MILPRTVLTALSVERPRPPRADPGAPGSVAGSQTRGMPVAVCFPRDDLRFAERVQTLLDGSHAEEPFGAAVQALLRETYPLAVISPRHELAALDGARVCYAFRDGSVVPAVDGDTS
jgi:hypothetical protein